MTRLFSVCVAFLALSACATTADLKLSLAKLVGQPVQTAIDRLGPPTAQTDEGGGQTTYVWETNHDVHYSTSEPPSTLGVRDPNEMAGGAGAGAAATTTTANYRCFVRLTAGGDGRIKTTAWGGNGDGCAAYASRLN